MNAKVSFLIMMISIAAVSCSRVMMAEQSKPAPIGDYAYTSFDKSGEKVVEGRISIESVEPRRIGNDEVPQIKGTWELKKVGNQQPIGGQVGIGELNGSIVKGEIILDLNPNMNDANVILTGTIEGKRFHGKWSFNGYAGSLNAGTFEAIRK